MSPEERNRDLGKRIELARRAVNLTQGELAEKMSAETGLPISKATISRIEAGTGRPIYEVETKRVNPLGCSGEEPPGG